MIKVASHFDAGVLKTQPSPINRKADNAESLCEIGEVLCESKLALLGDKNIEFLLSRGCLVQAASAEPATQVPSGDEGNGVAGRPVAPALSDSDTDEAE